MNAKKLIQESTLLYNAAPTQCKQVRSIHLFSNGAIWMHSHMNQSENNFPHSVPFTLYGLLKYGISLSLFFISLVLLYPIHILLLPLSIFFFYIAEVHFLFLFPLLIDNVENPIWQSIKQTYRLGIVKTVFTAILIAFFMLYGLINYTDPLRNWHIGCLALLIWYKNEVRDWIQPSV